MVSRDATMKRDNKPTTYVEAPHDAKTKPRQRPAATAYATFSQVGSPSLVERRKNREIVAMPKMPMFSVSKKPSAVLLMKAWLIAVKKAPKRPTELPPRSLPRKYTTMQVITPIRTGK